MDVHIHATSHELTVTSRKFANTFSKVRNPNPNPAGSPPHAHEGGNWDEAPAARGSA